MSSQSPSPSTRSLADKVIRAYGWRQARTPRNPFAQEDWYDVDHKQRKREYVPGILIYHNRLCVMMTKGRIDLTWDPVIEEWKVYKQGDFLEGQLDPLYALLEHDDDWRQLGRAWRTDALQHERNYAYRKIPGIGEAGPTKGEQKQWKKQEREQQSSSQRPVFGQKPPRAPKKPKK